MVEFPEFMMNYVDPQMVNTLQDETNFEKVFGKSKVQVTLTRRQRLMANVRYQIYCLREKIAYKIAPWVDRGE